MCQRSQKSMMSTAAKGARKLRGTIKEEVEGVLPGGQHLLAHRLGGHRGEDAKGEEAVDISGKDKLVDHAQKQQQDPAGKHAGVLVARRDGVRVLQEAPAAIDGTRGEGREEEQKVEVVCQGHLVDEAVAGLDHHLRGLEGDVRDAEKPQDALVPHSPNLVRDQWRDGGEQGCGVALV